MTGRFILRLRKRLALSQAELAARVGVDQTTIHRWETGTRPISGPAKKLIRQIANAS